MNEYRNRYCNKCRISHGVGDYALQFIDDLLNPSIKIPSKKGFKNRPINLYYYRKLYNDVVKDKVTGSNMYVLNSLGMEFKIHQLPKQIKKKVDTALSNLSIICNNRKLFDKMVESDVNTGVRFSFYDFKREYARISDIKDCLLRYAEYKLVYEDRFFKVKDYGNSKYGYFPDIDINSDFRKFIEPSCYHVTRSDVRLNSFLERCPEDWISYYAHPYFLRYMRVFSVLDMCSDYFFVQNDDKAQQEAEDRAATKRFHDKLKVKQYYSNFGK